MIRRDAPELSVLSTSVEIGGPPGRLKVPFNRVDGRFGRVRQERAAVGGRYAPELSVSPSSVEIGGPPRRLKVPFNRVDGEFGRVRQALAPGGVGR